MRARQLAIRNFKTILRDPLSLGLTIGLPSVMLFILQPLQDVDEFFTPTNLAPGIVLFGFVMLMFSSAMILSRDRETALFPRLLTAPLTSGDFLSAYSAPYLVIAVVQAGVIFAMAAVLGLEFEGSAMLVVLIMVSMAVLYVGLGIVLGAVLGVAPISGAYSAVLLLTIFAGTWFDLNQIGGPIQAVEDLLPFVHALDAARDVMTNGAGLGDIASDLTWVLAYTVAVVVVAGAAFRRRLVE